MDAISEKKVINTGKPITWKSPAPILRHSRGNTSWVGETLNLENVSKVTVELEYE